MYYEYSVYMTPISAPPTLFLFDLCWKLLIKVESLRSIYLSSYLLMIFWFLLLLFFFFGCFFWWFCFVECVSLSVFPVGLSIMMFNVFSSTVKKTIGTP